MAKKTKSDETNAADPETIPAESTPAEPAAETKPKIDWASPEQLAIYDCETQMRVKMQADKVSATESQYEHYKACASEWKKDLEADEKALRTLIKDRSERRGKPPMYEQKDLFNEAAPSNEWPPSNLWEKFPIERLIEFGLTQGDVDKFKAGECKKGIEGVGPIDTMGAMSRFTAPSDSGWTRKLTDIKGIGEATVDRYQEASDKFWEAWRNQGVAEAFAEEMGLKKPEPAAEAEDAPKSEQHELAA